MRTVAYVWLSTGGQERDSQPLISLDYAHRYGLMVAYLRRGLGLVMPRRAGTGYGAGAGPTGRLLLGSEFARLGWGVGQII